MSDEVLVKCENISKKFCRSLKRSLWYGVQDISSELNPFRGKEDIVGTSHFPKLRKDEFWAIQDVSFELKRGECLGLIGHNGAGKSTLLKMLNGLIKPDHGRISMKGRIGAIIELNAGFNPILTGRENVYIYGSILGFTKKEIDKKYDAIVEFAELSDFMEMPFKSYSSGMKVRLGFAVASQTEPDILIIDEVLAVGDVGFRSKCYNVIYKIVEHAAVIFVSHNMSHVDRLCTKGILMSKGEIIIQGDNIGPLIDYYLNKFNRDGISTLKKNSDIENYSICINGNIIEKNTYQEYGKPLNIEVKIKIPKVYKRIEIALSFMNSSLELIANSNTKLQDFSFENNGKLKSISVTFPKYQIGSGVHYLSFSIVDIDTNEIILWDYAFTSIITQYSQYISAPVHFYGEWHIESAMSG